MRSAIVGVDLGFGDAGKGSVTDFLVREFNADLVVRYSGAAQASHRVVLPDGREHRFSQWGAGTFAGVPTYLGPDVIVAPTAMMPEAQHLETVGIAAPWDMLRVDPDCLVSTPTHMLVNRAHEILRGEGRHGSCGMGIWETRRLSRGGDRAPYMRFEPEYAVRARDLRDPKVLREKLMALRAFYQQFEAYVAATTPTGPLSQDSAILQVKYPVGLEVDWLVESSARLIVGPMPDCGVAVFEGAQGVLLDENFGFAPYTTGSTVTTAPAFKLIPPGANHLVLGITRAYTTRHGAGPLPSESAAWPRGDRPRDPGNPSNRWQGDFRVGALDLPLLRYALAVQPVDGLFVTCLDQISGDGAPVCFRHEGGGRAIPLPRSLAEQESLASGLSGDLGVYRTLDFPGLLSEIDLMAPIAWLSGGPTHLDKVPFNWTTSCSTPRGNPLGR